MGHTEVVQYLYSRGADLNSVQYGGRTPLLNAAFAEEGEGTALFLVSTGAVTDQGGNSKSIKSFEVFFGIFFRQFFTPFDAVCICTSWSTSYRYPFQFDSWANFWAHFGAIF